MSVIKGTKMPLPVDELMDYNFSTHIGKPQKLSPKQSTLKCETQFSELRQTETNSFIRSALKHKAMLQIRSWHFSLWDEPSVRILSQWQNREKPRDTPWQFKTQITEQGKDRSGKMLDIFPFQIILRMTSRKGPMSQSNITFEKPGLFIPGPLAVIPEELKWSHYLISPGGLS